MFLDVKSSMSSFKGRKTKHSSPYKVKSNKAFIYHDASSPREDIPNLYFKNKNVN